MMSVLTARLYWFAMVVAVGVILIAPTWMNTPMYRP
jgi:hypothetical protein